MKKVQLILASILLTGFIGITTSCQKESTTENVSLTDVVEESAVDNTFEDIFADVDNELVGAGSSMQKSIQTDPDCMTRTVEHPEGKPFPKIITLDYGTGCTIPRGDTTITRKGKIVIRVNAEFMLSGSVRTVTFVDFYVNDNKLEGTHEITNNGKNSDGLFSFTETLTQGRITTADNLVIERTYTRTRTWIAGFDTPRYHMDDEFSITGTATGKTSEGKIFTKEITSPILAARTCAWFTKGVVEMTIGADVLVIDYGTGECDKIATRSLNGGTPVEFTLHRTFRKAKN